MHCRERRTRKISEAILRAAGLATASFGRPYRGMKLEARLMNVRAVQGIFDDLNPDTCGRWAQPDTGKWAAGRNTREFVLSINLQGGSPEGCSGGGESDHDVFARVRIMGLLRSGHE
jgi:hypothetical protein